VTAYHHIDAPAVADRVAALGSVAASHAMSTQERLHETERALGLAYPPSFVAAAQEFSDLIASEGFNRAFGDTRLLLSAPEIANARDSTPTAFLPFMRKENPTRPDIYAFDLRSKL